MNAPVPRWDRVGDDERTAEVNLTPLIDVSLVLVVILLLATPLAFESSFGLARAEPTSRSAAQEKQQARIELTIESDDAVRVNRTLVPMDGLGAALAPLLAESPTRDVTVRCEGAVTHGAFVRVLDQTKLNGARDIAIAGS